MKHLILIILLFLTACTTPKYVEVPKEVVKIEYKDRIRSDSIYIKDSINTSIRNDTVFITKYRYKYKTKIEKDTICKTDTLIDTKVVTEEVIKEVNRLKGWQIILMVIGGVSIGFLIFKLKNIIFKK